ncbi:hypothetical protein EVAR_52830_1 [Eumeta japonica]|uniref:Uncharacterized protein n=1 Tax=Eumeta variegata TaxID=151549 RepID=A0A4C1YE86_EUMVA|nr:hypothetical protein EVAR_52830_1 [Eumeta japonica]
MTGSAPRLSRTRSLGRPRPGRRAGFRVESFQSEIKIVQGSVPQQCANTHLGQQAQDKRFMSIVTFVDDVAPAREVSCYVYGDLSDYPTRSIRAPRGVRPRGARATLKLFGGGVARLRGLYLFPMIARRFRPRSIRSSAPGIECVLSVITVGDPPCGTRRRAIAVPTICLTSAASRDRYPTVDTPRRRHARSPRRQ